jgi:hypothetical protein
LFLLLLLLLFLKHYFAFHAAGIDAFLAGKLDGKKSKCDTKQENVLVKNAF